MMNKTHGNVAAPTPFILALLDAIFQELDWSGETELLNRFCEMMNHLTYEEQVFIINLTRDFLFFRERPYNKALRAVEEALSLKIPESAACLFALPLIKPEDVGKVKSASTVIYDLRYILQTIADERVMGFFDYDRYESLDKHKHRKNSILLFIDDFIGSGRTAKTAIEFYKQNFSVETDMVLVVTLAAQENAVQHLANMGVSCVCAHIRKRGISDSEFFPDKEAALKLMAQIEGKIGVRKKNRFGYQKSEALIAMRLESCPNNTFPIYWMKNGEKGKVWNPPFRRFAR